MRLVLLFTVGKLLMIFEAHSDLFRSDVTLFNKTIPLNYCLGLNTLNLNVFISALTLRNLHILCNVAAVTELI